MAIQRADTEISAGDRLTTSLSGFARSPLGIALVVGVVGRLILPFFGHNYDVDSYRIVAGIMDSGGNVYAETARYNYGPIWFHVLDVIKMGTDVVGGGDGLFRHGVAWFLTAVDVCLALLLAKRFNQWVGVAILMNPVSMIITGYHSQFDNLAVLFAFAGVILAFPQDKPDRRRFVAGLVLVGLSLAIKHIFILLPLWLVLRSTNWRDRALSAVVPYVVFFGSFAPYWSGGREGIEANVFRYRSFANAPLLRALTPWEPTHLAAFLVVVIALAVAAFVTRRSRSEVAVGVYTIVLVAFSPAIANQYLAIPVAGIAILGVTWFLPYLVVATYHLLTHRNGLGLLSADENPLGAETLYQISAVLLAAGLLARFVASRLSRRISSNTVGDSVT